MDPKQQIFRKVALERLSSPEQLDTLMKVIRPADWLIFAPLAGLLLVALLWSWFGSIPTKVTGRCILINPTGLADIGSVVSGRLTELSVKVGDRVRRQQEIGVIALPELADRIDKARQKLQELRKQGERVRQFASRSSQLNVGLIERQQQLLEAQQRSSKEHVHLLRERVASQVQLLSQGLITNQALLATRQELNRAENELSGIANQLAELNLKRLESDKQSELETASIDQQIEESRRQLDSLLQSQQDSAVIESPFDGRVIEIKAAPGMLLSEGAPLLSVERDSTQGQQLEAAIYVPAGEGKRVALGMVAQVTPATVKREEHGYMLGWVRYVSEYPASIQSIQMLLQNDILVRELAGNSPPIEIRAALQPADNASGFVWSSSAGAPIAIQPGTMCQADVVVATQRPISLVIPIFKKSIGVQ